MAWVYIDAEWFQLNKHFQRLSTGLKTLVTDPISPQRSTFTSPLDVVGEISLLAATDLSSTFASPPNSRMPNRTVLVRELCKFYGSHLRSCLATNTLHKLLENYTAIDMENTPQFLLCFFPKTEQGSHNDKFSFQDRNLTTKILNLFKPRKRSRKLYQCNRLFTIHCPICLNHSRFIFQICLQKSTFILNKFLNSEISVRNIFTKTHFSKLLIFLRNC